MRTAGRESAGAGSGGLGGRETAAAAAQDASRSRMDTPATAYDGGWFSVADMDASWSSGAGAVTWLGIPNHELVTM
jgi:hypothetical protein